MTHKVSIRELAAEFGIRENTLYKKAKERSLTGDATGDGPTLYNRKELSKIAKTVTGVATPVKRAAKLKPAPRPKKRNFNRRVISMPIDSPLGGARESGMLAVVFVRPSNLKTLLSEIG